MRSMLVGLLLLATTGLAAPPAERPSFDCTDAEKVAYKIWLTDEKKLMQVSSAGRAREIVLSAANLLRKAHGKDSAVAYDGFKAIATNVYDMLDLGNEFSVRYVKASGATHAEVSIVIDGAEKTGLTCRSHGNAITVEPPQGPTPKRYAALAVEGAAQRTIKGSLTPVGILLIEAALRRMVASPDYKNEAARGVFIEDTADALRSVEETSINRVERRLPKPVAAFWGAILTSIRYKYYPEASRYAAWVKEGGRPEPDRDLESVVAGFEEFYKCRDSGVKDIRTFFVTEVTPVLKGFSQADSDWIGVHMSPSAGTFFNELWSKAVGRRTLASYPEIASTVKEIASILDAKEFEPQKLQEKLSAFLRSSLAADPEARQLFVQAASAQIKRLTARQQEDMSGWLDDETEKKFFSELLR
jgi:hypothetical protein